MSINYKLELMYDGSAFSGWQRQKNARTVCGELESAIEIITKQDVELCGVSRTDAGVHANEYVANFFMNIEFPPEKLVVGINAICPDGISVKKAEITTNEFNSRFDVKSKTYVYTIDNTQYGNPFMRKYAWHFKYPLDLEAMQKACRFYLGTHDFSAFMSQGSTAKNFERTIYDASVTKDLEGIIRFSVTGDGFLYNMVRIMAGTLVWVGKGAISPSQIPDIIASKDRKRAGVTAPPHGLMLYKLNY
ncbi:MAG: tRNA pseudouridine(38-40) synthase TruA [Ruminococcaceae bacterium]|nr:tRNA pseudouridine(38-40) synthase TruA [Oscillospiraceae bacterium]